MFIFVGVIVPFRVCEKLHVCKVGAVGMGSAEHFRHLGDHGFIVNVE